MGILDNLINNFSNKTNNTSFNTEQYIFVELDQVIKKFENTNKRKEKNIELKIEEFLNNELDIIVHKKEVFQKIKDIEPEAFSFFTGLNRVLTQLYPKKFNEVSKITQIIFKILNQLFLDFIIDEKDATAFYITFHQNYNKIMDPSFNNELASFSNSVYNRYIDYEASQGDIDLIKKFSKFSNFKTQAYLKIHNEFEDRNIMDPYYFGLFHGFSRGVWIKFKDELEEFLNEDLLIDINFRSVSKDQENNFLLYWDTMKLNDDYIEGYRKGRKLEI